MAGRLLLWLPGRNFVTSSISTSYFEVSCIKGVKQVTKGEQKAGSIGGCMSISRLALETGIEFGHAASILHDRGDLPLSQQIMSCSAFETNTPVSSSPAAWLAEITHYHVALDERSRGVEKSRCGNTTRGLVALQRKLIGAIQKNGNTAGLEAASLAMSFEDAAALLSDEFGQARFCRRLVDLAASTTDRCVLTERYRDFNGLVSDAAIKACRSFPDAARDLRRLGHLSPGDPRAKVTGELAHRHDKLGAEDFVIHLKSNLWSEIPRVRTTHDGTFSRQEIVRDLTQLPKRDQSSRTQLDLDKRDRNFMQVVARVAERTAMNRHGTAPQTSSARNGILDMLATSAAATNRANGYGQRVRRAELELGVKTARRDSEPVIN